MFPPTTTRGASAISRRSLLLGGAGLAAVTLGGCSFFETEPAGSDAGGASSGPKGAEAPSLAAQVEAGELPPVQERLPAAPMVVEPHAEIGEYGGTWRSVIVTEEDRTWLTQAIGYEPLVRWIPEWTGAPGTSEIIPNVAEKFEELEDGRVFQFTLREGMKWSDGEPLTAEDFRFVFEDVNLNSELHPGGFYGLFTEATDPETPATFESDGNVIRYVFAEPKPGFIEELASGTIMCLPVHYVSQFHPDHNPDIDALVSEAGFSDWMQLWEAKNEAFTNVEMPTLYAWSLTAALGDGSYVTAERNPYYWKVDPDGSQLPYVDSIRCEIVQDIEVELLKVTNGELDMQMRNFGTIRNLPVVADARERGDYKMFTVLPQGPNALVIAFNQTHDDARLRSIYSNKDFRVGLSHALNRQRVIDTVYAGQPKPWQAAPREHEAVYHEELATQYLEYSVDKANEALDASGFTERDGNGFRMAEGERITVTVLVPATMPDHIDAFELIKQDWAEVGVDTNISVLAETLYWERVEANLAEASTWTCGGFEVRASQGSNHYYLPSNPRGASRYGNKWALWYRGQLSEEPPAEVKRQLELFDEMRATYDGDRALELAQEILEITKDMFYYIGVCTEADSYGIVRNDFATNVPDVIAGQTGYQPPGPTNPEQYFFKTDSED